MRTTEDKVRALGRISSNEDVSPYIEIANAIVDQLVGECSSASPIILELIERNLACHYAYAAGIRTAATITSKSIAGASESFNRPASSSKDLVLNSPFGETAIQLDPCKKLPEILTIPASLTYLGNYDAD